MLPLLQGAHDEGLLVTRSAPLRLDRERVAARYDACSSAPTVCGVAIDVPLIVIVIVSNSHHADVMFTPRANQSAHNPGVGRTTYSTGHLA